MKFLKIFLKIIIFSAGLAAAFWVFMPWGSIGEYVVLNAERVAADKGVNMRHSSVHGTWVGPTVSVNDLVARMALGGGAFKTLSVSPLIAQSLMHLSPAASISFSGGELFLPGGAVSPLGEGTFEVSLSNEFITITSLPEQLKNTFSSMKNFLPLTEEADGTWKLKRDKPNG